MKSKIIKNILNDTIKTIIFTMIVFALFAPTANADYTARNLTGDATYKTNSDVETDSAVDGSYLSGWHTNEAADKYLQIESKNNITYLYVCYEFKPTELVIQTSGDGDSWQDVIVEADDESYHVTYTFDIPTKFIRIKGTETSIGKFGITELKIFSAGTLPHYVQRWEPPYDKVDMMIFSAHPDDEAVFFSGLIPYYAGEMDKKIAVVYMTVSNPFRRSEALNYQWAIHETHLPLFADFPDVFEEDTYSYTRSRWGEQETIDYMVSMIREKKPDIIVSHDLKGEYGHGNHIFTAKCLQKAVALTNVPTYHTLSYEQFGAHEVKKLYLHLYPDSRIHMEAFDEPLEEYGGLTAIEVAKIALRKYVSQLQFSVVRVHDDQSDFSCYDYGLAYTTVGYDSKGNDMFENIEVKPTPTPEASPSPEPTPAPETSPVVSPAASANKTGIQLTKRASLLFSIAAGIALILCILLILSLAKSIHQEKKR